MRRKKGCNVAVLLLLGVAAICVLIFTRGEHPKCGIETLILDEDQMSEQWRITDDNIWPAFLLAQDRLGAQEAFRMAMKNDDNGMIGHTVYRYRNRWLAIFHLWFDKAVFFPSISTDWSEYQEANNWPLHADQQYIRCGVATCPPLADYCSAVLRYGPYISDFDVSTSGEGAISLEEFKEIVLKINERFISCEE